MEKVIGNGSTTSLLFEDGCRIQFWLNSCLILTCHLKFTN